MFNMNILWVSQKMLSLCCTLGSIDTNILHSNNSSMNHRKVQSSYTPLGPGQAFISTSEACPGPNDPNHCSSLQLVSVFQLEANIPVDLLFQVARKVQDI